MTSLGFVLDVTLFSGKSGMLRDGATITFERGLLTGDATKARRFPTAAAASRVASAVRFAHSGSHVEVVELFA